MQLCKFLTCKCRHVRILWFRDLAIKRIQKKKFQIVETFFFEKPPGLAGNTFTLWDSKWDQSNSSSADGEFELPVNVILCRPLSVYEEFYQVFRLIYVRACQEGIIDFKVLT